MEYLTNEQFLSFIDPVLESFIDPVLERDLHNIVKEKSFNGYAIKNFNNEMINFFFPNPNSVAQYLIFKNRINGFSFTSTQNLQENFSSNPRQETDYIPQPSYPVLQPIVRNCTSAVEGRNTQNEPIQNGQNDCLFETNNSIVYNEENNHFIQENSEERDADLEQIPLAIKFPKNLVGPILSKILSDTTIQVRKGEINELVRIIFDQMRKYNLLYPTHDEYYEFSKSILKQYPHLLKQDKNMLKVIQQKLKSRFAEFRRNPDLTDQIEVQKAKKKFGKNNKKNQLIENTENIE
ncbi:unnamed protein product [Brachionus calyciflorus]|uniref:Uncharacterized protein n=1 Tax=Brachionus calyciflorus TaxID=104777 RepID=A0A813UUL0_9BILA|nr:unnamed protein product [Brachionus calyciflorus]